MPTNFNVGGFNANVNANIVHFSDGTNQTTAYSEPANSKQLFVDQNRTDTFVPDGSFDRPFSTIMAAVNQVAANGDNGTYPYVINIAPGLYAETINLSAPQLVNLVFNGANGVIVGNSSMTVPLVESVNNDNLLAVIFIGMIFALNGHTTHGVEFSSTTSGTQLGSNGIIFRDCGMQDNVSDIYFNNVSFIQFDNTGITANVDTTNVNSIQFVNGNGPNPQTPFTIATDTGTATPRNFPGFSRGFFTSCGVGSVTCDALSQVQITNCAVSGTVTTASPNIMIVTNSFLSGDLVVSAGGVLGLVNSLVGQLGAAPTPSVTVNGTMLSALTAIFSVPITVNSGGIFIELGGIHDYGELTVNSGGAYSTQGDMGVGSLTLTEHLNNTPGNPDLCGVINIVGGTAASFTFENPYNSEPVVVVTPLNDTTSTGPYWVTASATGFTVNLHSSGTITFNYVVIGNPS